MHASATSQTNRFGHRGAPEGHWAILMDVRQKGHFDGRDYFLATDARKVWDRSWMHAICIPDACNLFNPHTHTHMHVHSHKHTKTHTHTHTLSLSHTHTPIHTHTFTPPPTQIHIHTHTYTNTHTQRTHTHTHNLN